MEKVCCAGSCGQCGGPACASLPGGYDSCCTGGILKQNITCADGDSFGCIVPMVNQVAEEEPNPTPTPTLTLPLTLTLRLHCTHGQPGGRGGA